MGRKPGELNEKHWKAITLIKEGNLYKKEIAAQLGWSEDYFRHLYSGNIEKAGLVADLFVKELKKVEQERDTATNALIKENTSLAQAEINRILKEIRDKKTVVSQHN